MELKTTYQDKWDEAYGRGGNILFYPHEEIVRFVNKYVRKRIGISDFKNIMPLTETEWRSFRSLDLGCGIGRHVKFLDEFDLNPYGIDLSGEAIGIGKQWMHALGKQDLAEKLSIGSVTELPYEDEFFNICVSHSVLDCMPRSQARIGLIEALRVLKNKGMMYLDFYMDDKIGDGDIKAQIGFDKDTVKSYYTIEGIKKLIGDAANICEFKIISATDIDGNQMEYGRRAHLILQKGF